MWLQLPILCVCRGLLIGLIAPRPAALRVCIAHFKVTLNSVFFIDMREPVSSTCLDVLEVTAVAHCCFSKE